MVGSGSGSVEERLDRLEARVKEQENELRYVLRRVNRVLMHQGSAATEAGRDEERDSPPPVTEPSFAPPVRPPRPISGETQRPQTNPRESEESVQPAAPEPTRVVAAAGEEGDGGRFRLPFEFGGLRSGEWWLNKVGIALLLFGVAFLFKFSWDQGWLQALLTPWVRVGVGLAIGAALISIGFRVAGERRAFGQVLFGGGIGVFYITGFSAFQVLELVPYTVAFVFMVAVTVLAFTLSLRQNEAVLSVIGISGGLATPFLLYDDSGPLGGLVLYASLILAGAMGVHFFKGWRSLLPISFLGFWTVLLIGYSDAASYPENISLDSQRALRAGVVFGWLALWLVPVTREVLRSRNASRWTLPEPGAIVRAIQGERIVQSGTYMHALSFAMPLVALMFTQGIWEFEKSSLGWVALGLAAAHALAFAVFRRIEHEGHMAYTQALAALLLGTLSLVLMLEGNALLFTLAAEAAAMHLLARRLSDRILSAGAHLLSLVVVGWLLIRLIAGTVEGTFAASSPTAFFEVGTLVDLAVIALLFASSLMAAPSVMQRAYRTTAHAAVVGLLLRELLPLHNGGTYALVAWAVYAAGLHLLSRRRPEWGTLIGSHLLSGIVGVWLGFRLVGGTGASDSTTTPVFNLAGISDLFVVVLAVLITFLPMRPEVRASYRILAHAALLVWLWRELSMLPAGDAYVSMAWGICGAGLLVLGLRRDNTYLVRSGMVTLFLVVAKLFLWDLAWVEAIWRVLLFMGFGGLFLFLSYYLRAVWRPGAGSNGPTRQAP